MNIFKRHKDNLKAKTWNDISLRQFQHIQELLSEEDEYTTFNVIDYIYGIDSTNMPVSELSKYSVAFLSQKMPHVKLKKHYVLNGRKYDSNFDLTVVSAGQFVDFQNYVKEEKPAVEKQLSVFFVPVGHTYGDGYDVKQVQEDLLELDMPTINEAAFFFEKQFRLFVSLFQYYLTQTMEKMETSEEKKKVLELLNRVDLADLVSFHTY